VVNATSSSTHGEPSCFPRASLRRRTAYDMAYGAAAGPFLDGARASGLARATAWACWWKQAAESFLLWRGKRPDTAGVIAALRGREAPRAPGGWAALAAAAVFVAYELSILVRLAWWRTHDPQATAFMEQRLERLREKKPQAKLRQQWVPYARISPSLKRAIVAAEDAKFADHEGFDWRRCRRPGRRTRSAARWSPAAHDLAAARQEPLPLGERTPWRKAQEAMITVMLESVMDKRRHPGDLPQRDRVGRRRLRGRGRRAPLLRHERGRAHASQAARLAAMVPSPRFYDRNRSTPWLERKTQIILARMDSAEVP